MTLWLQNAKALGKWIDHAEISDDVHVGHYWLSVGTWCNYFPRTGAYKTLNAAKSAFGRYFATGAVWGTERPK